MGYIIYIYISLFRTLQVPRAGKCTESDEGMYKAGTTCNSDSDEKSPPSNDFKHSGMIKYLWFQQIQLADPRIVKLIWPY